MEEEWEVKEREWRRRDKKGLASPFSNFKCHYLLVVCITVFLLLHAYCIIVCVITSKVLFVCTGCAA